MCLKTHHPLYATNEEESHSYQFQVPVEYVLQWVNALFNRIFF